MPLLEVKTMQEFNTLITNANTPVICDFYADWCGPCKRFTPIIEEYSKKAEYANIYFTKINVDVSEDIATYCSVTAMPTFIAFYKKQKISSFTGANFDLFKQMVQQCSVLN
jgi:thioredoxin 1